MMASDYSTIGKADNALADSLRSALANSFSGVEAVQNLNRLSGGANQETWSFDAITSGGIVPLILRRSPGGGITAEGGFTPNDHISAMNLKTEAGLIQAAERAGVPVPTVVLILQPEHGLGPGFVMGRIEGETLPRRILRDEAYATVRPDLARQCGSILARIHSIPVADLEGIASLPVERLLAHHRDLYDRYDSPRPVFELAFRWLEERQKPAPRLALVHGDFRNGNLIIGGDGVRAVLDWELAHIGDPLEDLGWICVNSWRFGRMDRPVGGFGDREDLYRGYEAAGGADPGSRGRTPGGTIDRARIRFWEVFGTLKWGIACMTMCEVFRSARDRSVERAVIGRRASETEIDLLRLIEEED